jgi:hypothetical protein
MHYTAWERAIFLQNQKVFWVSMIEIFPHGIPCLGSATAMWDWAVYCGLGRHGESESLELGWDLYQSQQTVLKGSLEALVHL